MNAAYGIAILVGIILAFWIWQKIKANQRKLHLKIEPLPPGLEEVISNPEVGEVRVVYRDPNMAPQNTKKPGATVLASAEARAQSLRAQLHSQRETLKESVKAEKILADEPLLTVESNKHELFIPEVEPVIIPDLKFESVVVISPEEEKIFSAEVKVPELQKPAQNMEKNNSVAFTLNDTSSMPMSLEKEKEKEKENTTSEPLVDSYFVLPVEKKSAVLSNEIESSLSLEQSLKDWQTLSKTKDRVAPEIPVVNHTGTSEPLDSVNVETLSDQDVPVLLTPPQTNFTNQEAEPQSDLFAFDRTIPPRMYKTLPKLDPKIAHKESLVAKQVETLNSSKIEPVIAAKPVEVPKPKKPKVEHVITFHVVSNNDAFHGEDLLRAILSYGLRYGDLSIFHRHEKSSGQGKILFSMAKAVDPGTFDLHQMSVEPIIGVSFFLTLPGYQSLLAYDIMVDTARRLAQELHGYIMDQHQQTLTPQLTVHYRERIQEYERLRLMNR